MENLVTALRVHRRGRLRPAYVFAPCDTDCEEEKARIMAVADRARPNEKMGIGGPTAVEFCTNASNMMGPDTGSGVVISVVIPTYNRPDQLASCLRLLAPGVQTLDAACYEVIVTDNSSLTPARDLLSSEFSFVRWIEGPKTGPAENRNCGAAAARGRLLAFTDDDCLPDAGWLEAFAAAAAREPDAVLEGRTYPGRPRRSLAEESPVNETGGNLWSCNFAIPRDNFLRIGGFDPQYPYGFEDIDLCIRCKSQGWRIEFLPAASVCHPWRIARGWKSMMLTRSSLLVFMDKHPDAMHFRSLRFWAGLALLTCFRDLVKGGWAYRGAGLWYPIERIGFQLVMIWTLCIKRPPYARRHKVTPRLVDDIQRRIPL